MWSGKALAERVERTGSNISENHSEGRKRGRKELGMMTVMAGM
jgi:hypothetical protein